MAKVQSDDWPNEGKRWAAKLQELYAIAIDRRQTWQKPGAGPDDAPVEISKPNPDVRGAVEVCRLALQLYGCLSAVAGHPPGCSCARCRKVAATAEDGVISRVSKMRRAG